MECYTEVKLDYDSSPFSSSEHLNIIHVTPTQFIDSLLLPVGDSEPALFCYFISTMGWSRKAQ